MATADKPRPRKPPLRIASLSLPTKKHMPIPPSSSAMVVDIQEEVGPARVGERIYNSDLYVGVHWMLRIRPATFSLCSMQDAITSPNPNGSIGTPFVVQHIFFARCLCQTPPLMTPFAHPLWLQCLAANSSPLCFICTSLVAAGGSLFSM